MKKIYLVSNGFKILSIMCSLLLFIIWYCVCFLVKPINLGAIIYSTFIMLFCFFAVYISFYRRIFISKSKLVITQIKKYEIELAEIIDIYTKDELINQNIIYILTKDRTYKFTGCNTLIGWEQNIKNTKKIVLDLKEFLNLTT